MEYEEDECCCVCGRQGAWLINGNYYCEYCIDELEEEEDEEIDIF